MGATFSSASIGGGGGSGGGGYQLTKIPNQAKYNVDQQREDFSYKRSLLGGEIRGLYVEGNLGFSSGSSAISYEQKAREMQLAREAELARNYGRAA